ncbi:hypothetical protein D7D25_14655 [Proteiniphilum sp. X52]|nr:hypothetical protein D7D25_14655 [Proteiniphilum sp. X52]
MNLSPRNTEEASGKVPESGLENFFSNFFLFFLFLEGNDVSLPSGRRCSFKFIRLFPAMA